MGSAACVGPGGYEGVGHVEEAAAGLVGDGARRVDFRRQRLVQAEAALANLGDEAAALVHRAEHAFDGRLRRWGEGVELCGEVGRPGGQAAAAVRLAACAAHEGRECRQVERLVDAAAGEAALQAAVEAGHRLR